MKIRYSHRSLRVKCEVYDLHGQGKSEEAAGCQ